MAIVLIDALPNFISPDEHRNLVASTPASFSDIPPVLRHKEDNVSITLDPPVDAFSAADAANGSLYVIESHLVFMSATGRGFQLEYPSITLHAISRGEQGPSIYCQLDDTINAPENTKPQNDEEDVADMSELTILPKDPSALEPIFEALSLCASLHPDPGADDEMDHDDDAFVDPGEFETFNGTADEELSEVGRAALSHLESIIYNPFDKPAPTEQFEDAPEQQKQKPKLAETEKEKPVANGESS
ncbi:Methylosome subunit pICln [Trametes pubescens]|uniref:Methylosome subunit pICln n=1 Tax=Trametes pubescens TaxID=154538 RepID=A0A1M2VPR1_TRAPU|nr:Methylosome subunit pICln [Trametes pubescens]